MEARDARALGFVGECPGAVAVESLAELGDGLEERFPPAVRRERAGEASPETQMEGRLRLRAQARDQRLAHAVVGEVVALLLAGDRDHHLLLAENLQGLARRGPRKAAHLLEDVRVRGPPRDREDVEEAPLVAGHAGRALEERRGRVDAQALGEWRARSIRRPEATLLEEVAQDLLDEEREALARLGDARGESLRQLGEAEHGLEEAGDVLVAERGELHDARRRALGTRLDEARERPARDVVDAIAPEKAELRERAALRAEREKGGGDVDGAVPRPLQVVDVSDVRRDAAEPDEERGDGLDHAPALGVRVGERRRRRDSRVERERRDELDHLRRVAVQERLRTHGRREARGLQNEARHRAGIGEVALEAVDLEERDAAELDGLPHLAHEARLPHAARPRDEEAGVPVALEARFDRAAHVLHLAGAAHERAREEVVHARVARLELVREAARPVDLVEELGGARGAPGGIDGAEPLDDSPKPRRDASGVIVREAHGLGELPLEENAEALRRAEGRLARQQAVRHDAEAVEVGAVVAFLRARDLGREVVRSSHHEPADAAQAREAEVEHLDLADVAPGTAGADHDIAGLEVEVDDAAAVEVGERADDGHEEVERFLPRHDPPGRGAAHRGHVERRGRRRRPRVGRLRLGVRFGQEPVERHAGQELHREEERVVARDLLEVVHARDVRVAQ